MFLRIRGVCVGVNAHMLVRGGVFTCVLLARECSCTECTESPWLLKIPTRDDEAKGRLLQEGGGEMEVTECLRMLTAP